MKKIKRHIKKFKPSICLILVLVALFAIYLYLYLLHRRLPDGEGGFSAPFGEIKSIILGILSIFGLLVVAANQLKKDLKNLRWPEKSKADDKPNKSKKIVSDDTLRKLKKLRDSDADPILSLPEPGAELPEKIIWTSKKIITPKTLVTIIKGIHPSEQLEIAKLFKGIAIVFDGFISQMESVSGDKLRLSIPREGFIFTLETRGDQQVFRIKDKVRVTGVIVAIGYQRVLVGKAKVINLSV